MNNVPESVANNNGTHDVRGTENSDSSLDSLPTDEFLRVVGLRVRKQRSALTMSRKRLAEVSGVSERYLAQLESGQGNMSIALLRKVTTAIGVSLAALLSAEMSDAKPKPADPSVAALRANGESSDTHAHRPTAVSGIRHDETSLV
jgi:transcriptional regulator with XRE-family HTH domain